MDEKTQTFYETQAYLLAQRYESLPVPYPEEFLSHLKPGSSVLDIGSGSGRDLAFLLSKGHEVQGLEPSTAFIKEAYAQHPELKGRIQQAALPLKHPNLFSKTFDAVFMTAMIMHIADHDLFSLILQIKSWLKPGGLCILSASYGRSVDAGCRADDGRLFIERPKAEIQLLFERLGFSQVAERENADSLSREGIHWYSLIFRAQDPFSAAPADQIETIISRDRKDATYKLALLRALCDIAQGEPHQARFLPDHRVGVPLGQIAEKWLFYYWPLFESETFIPQKRGFERNKKVAFREALTDVITAYRCRGGLSTFYADFRSGCVDTSLKPLVDRAVNKIAAEGIIDGPVKYAGSALDSKDSFFSATRPYSAKGRCWHAQGASTALGLVTMGAGVWRELCLIGYWIREALVLRWAELTHEISERQLPLALIIEKLLAKPTIERDQALARKIYQGKVERCAWSDRSLRNGFDADHVIPFRQWYNNDLWNLLPTHPNVNKAKKDLLVTQDLILQRRESILQCWQIAHEFAPERFELEIQRCLLYGRRSTAWLEAAFSGLLATIEILATQKGLLRWPLARKQP